MPLRKVLLALFLMGPSAACASEAQIVPLQGLNGTTLVAGKSTAFRIYSDADTLAKLVTVSLTIVRPDGSAFTTGWNRPSMVFIPNGSLGPSAVLDLLGANLPWVGSYRVTAKLFDVNNASLGTATVDRMQLLPTKDLIVGLDMVNHLGPDKPFGINPAPASEVQGARDAIARMAAIMPIRDGISTPDGDKTAGLRLAVNNAPESYGCDGNPQHSDCQGCRFFAKMFDVAPGSDVLNIGIEYRSQNPAEGGGGIAPKFCTNEPVGFADLVFDVPAASGMAQESGHVFGLEPANDPHYDTTVQAGHSKDITIDPLASEQGFDPQTNAAFPAPSFDAMHQIVCGCPNIDVAYNVYDWELLRKAFAGLKSTGPGLPEHVFSDTTPSIAGAAKGAYFFELRPDGKIGYNYAVLGQAGIGWQEVDGDGRSDSAPASAAIGGHVFVAIRGRDGQVLLNQADEGKPFGSWFPMNFTTDVAPAVATQGDTVFVIAKRSDKRIFAAQAQLGKSFSGWFELQGGGQTNDAPAAAGAGGRIFVAIRGTDGRLQLNQAKPGQAWSGWTSLNITTNLPPALIGVKNDVLAFATAGDGRVLEAQSTVGHGFGPWSEVPGGLRSSSAPAGAAVNTHLYVGAINATGGQLVVNQSDLGHPFGFWFS